MTHATSVENALILAAGLGRRLGPHTERRPKPLTPVAGRPIIDRTLRALELAGCRRVRIVTGHGAELIESYLETSDHDLEVETVYNPDYATSNNIVSFLLGTDGISGGVISINCDVLFDPSLLIELASSAHPNRTVIDREAVLDAEATKVTVDDDGVVTGMHKEIPIEDAHGESIGISRFDDHGLRVVRSEAEALLADGRDDVFFTQAIANAVDRVDVRVMDTAGRPWVEIDDEHDHERATAIAPALDAILW